LLPISVFLEAIKCTEGCPACGNRDQASLKDFRGKWVVLYFYPKDFTSGCTLEAHNFQTDLDKLQKS